MKKNIALEVSGLDKSFKLPHENSKSIKSTFLKGFKKKTYEIQKALNDVSFSVYEGEFFGIVGKNGSGKSTLLKCIAGVYHPTGGSINFNGKLIPFIELGVGFNPELTGRENIYLNGALLGFSREKVDSLYQDIVDFAELERFMDQKLKNYSSGMQVRLAFSIAIRAEGDILILDEVLAVGDTAFQQKCFDFFAKQKKMNKTIIFVTHDMASVERFCSRALLLENGVITKIGKPNDITKRYNELNRKEIEKNEKDTNNKVSKNNFFSVSGQAWNNKKAINTFFPEDRTISLKFSINPKEVVKDAFVGITIQKGDGQFVYWKTTEEDNLKIKEFTPEKKVNLSIELQNIFGNDDYYVNLLIKSNDRTKEYFVKEPILKFSVSGRKGKHGWMFHPNEKITVR